MKRKKFRVHFIIFEKFHIFRGNFTFFSEFNEKIWAVIKNEGF